MKHLHCNTESYDRSPSKACVNIWAGDLMIIHPLLPIYGQVEIKSRKVHCYVNGIFPTNKQRKRRKEINQSAVFESGRMVWRGRRRDQGSVCQVFQKNERTDAKTVREVRKQSPKQR